MVNVHGGQLYSFCDFNLSHAFLQEHHEKDIDDEHSPEQIHLMQTQDVKYVSMKKTIESNKIRRMQSELHMTDVANKVKNTHILFTDSNEKEMDLAERLNTHPAMLIRRTNRPRLEDLSKILISDKDVEVSSIGRSFTCWIYTLPMIYYSWRRKCIRSVMKLTMN